MLKNGNYQNDNDKLLQKRLILVNIKNVLPENTPCCST